MSQNNFVLPDLQACLFCEDVRTEISGQQTLVGVIGAIPAPGTPIGLLRACLWTRWAGGIGEFTQRSVILNCDDEQPLAEAELQFKLATLEANATNVHVFAGLQFNAFGAYPVEIHLEGQLRLRFLLPIIHVPRQQMEEHN